MTVAVTMMTGAVMIAVTTAAVTTAVEMTMMIAAVMTGKVPTKAMSVIAAMAMIAGAAAVADAKNWMPAKMIRWSRFSRICLAREPLPSLLRKQRLNQNQKQNPIRSGGQE